MTATDSDEETRDHLHRDGWPFGVRAPKPGLIVIVLSRAAATLWRVERVSVCDWFEASECSLAS